jgi:HPt (histidine-containing phosphotransfer) domain-containing protein
MDTENIPFAAQLRTELPEAAFRHVLGVFQTEMEGLARHLCETAAAGDPDGFQKIAHRITGTACAVGARELELGARRAMKTAKTRPESIGDMAAEIAQLSEAARFAAAALLVGIR